jgi:hypothetical protein
VVGAAAARVARVARAQSLACPAGATKITGFHRGASPEVAAELELLAPPAAWLDAVLYARRCYSPQQTHSRDALSRCARYSMPTTTAAVTVRPNRVAKQAISPAPPPSLGAGRAASSASRFIFVFLAAEITDGRPTDSGASEAGAQSHDVRRAVAGQSQPNPA